MEPTAVYLSIQGIDGKTGINEVFVRLKMMIIKDSSRGIQNFHHKFQSWFHILYASMDRIMS